MRLFAQVILAFTIAAAVAGCTNRTTGSFTPYAGYAYRAGMDSGGGIPGKGAVAPTPSPTP